MARPDPNRAGHSARGDHLHLVGEDLALGREHLDRERRGHLALVVRVVGALAVGGLPLLLAAGLLAAARGLAGGLGLLAAGLGVAVLALALALVRRLVLARPASRLDNLVDRALQQECALGNVVVLAV